MNGLNNDAEKKSFFKQLLSRFKKSDKIKPIIKQIAINNQGNNNFQFQEIKNSEITTLINNGLVTDDVEKMLKLLFSDFKVEIVEIFKQIGYNTVHTLGNENIVLKDINNSSITINQIPNDLLMQLAENLKKLLASEKDDTDGILRYSVPVRPSYFVGRANKLTEIHEKIAQIDNRQNIFLVSGVGGMGKTTLVQKYINSVNCQMHFQRMIYISVQNDLERVYIDTIAKVFKIDLTKCPKTEDQKQLINDTLIKCKGNNLIFIDNANDKDQLEFCLELFKASNWKFLITTRTQPDKYRFAMIDVNELEMSEAISLFQHYYNPKKADEKELTLLLNHIFRHTLLTELLAKVGLKKGWQVSKLFEILNEQDRLIKAMGDQKLAIPVDTGLHAEFNKGLKYDTLHHYIRSLFEPEKLDTEHITMVRFFSVLPADDISIAHLKTLWRVNESEENNFEERLDYLKQWGWLSGKHIEQINKNIQSLTYAMHPLVQEVVYDKLPPDADNVEPLVITVTQILDQPLNYSFEFMDFAKSIIDKLNLLNNRN